MNKIKILEVNNIDLAGRRFNGYNMIEELSNKDFDIKQAVIIKQSENERVVKILNNELKIITTISTKDLITIFSSYILTNIL